MLADAPWRKGVTVEGVVLAIVSGVEFGALTTGKWSPWTPVVRQLPPVPRAILLGAIYVWGVRHFGPWRR